MKFGPVPVAEAGGAILAHSVAFGGRRLRKGRRLTASDIAEMAEAGLSSVTVAILAEDDVHEDAAAERLARALVTSEADLTLQAPHTGRVNILAKEPGIVRLNAEAIHAVNAVHPMITVATVPEWHRMDPRGMIATVKIISYAVSEADLRQAETRAHGAISFARPVRRAPVLFQTVVSGDDGAKGHEATEGRLAALGVTLPPKVVVPHQTDTLCDALLRQVDRDLILILTGSATSDLHDVAPEAVRAAGGTVAHYGMPVDPGNLLFLGELSGRPVIGLPGCARSPALNGADWVLERLVCGVPVTGQDIMGMGVGGLLKEIPTRPQPRRKRDG
ncbi:molybdopterin-binding protein [Shimia ponticola]|uniref:molybdopterin-binding protein n=1 Tax=Shimia ponticola TaxID=2582893 RepID=UPI0011BF957E|nr:molybdopterin-binding protein [Shimia ponticola]